MKGDLTKRHEPMVGTRALRRVPRRRVDAQELRVAMKQALSNASTCAAIVSALHVDYGTLLRYAPDDYKMLKSRATSLRVEQRLQAQLSGLQAAEDFYLQSWRAGKLPTSRRASQVTGRPWWPGQWKTVALLLLRNRLDDAGLEESKASLQLGTAYLGELDKACARIQVEKNKVASTAVSLR